MSALAAGHAQKRVAALVAGLVVGWLVRNVPLWIAVRIADPDAPTGCGMEEVLACAVENLPAVLGAFVEIAILLAGVSAVWAAAGVASAVVSLALRPTTAQRALVGLILSFAAGALLLPPLRLALAVLVGAVRS